MRVMRAYAANEAGSILPMFGLMLVPIFACVALAVDYGSIVANRTKLQTAVDAAALAGASSNGSIAAGLERAAAHLTTVLPGLNLDGQVASVDVTPSSSGGGVVVDVLLRYDTKFGGVIGFSQVDIPVRAKAQSPGGVRVLDVAMCIDATGSMQPTLDAVKANAMGFRDNINAALTARNIRVFDAIRLRPIFFRDYGGNAGRYSVAGGGQVDKFPNGWQNRPAGDSRNLGDDVPMRAAKDFYNMVNQSSTFDAFVTGETESGGGDYPESGLECLNEAISSTWTKVGDTVTTARGNETAAAVFSVVAHWTDDDAQPPGYGPSLANANYPPAPYMPRTYAGLEAKWTSEAVIPQANKLLAFFTPVAAPDFGYAPVKTWNRFLQAGTLSSGTTQMVDSIAGAVAQVAGGPGAVRLSQ